MRIRTLCGALLAHQALVNRRSRPARVYVAVNLGATAALLAVARREGLTAAEIGLVRVPAGLRRGAWVGAAAAGGLSALLALPAGRRALRDRRLAGMTARESAGEVLLRIPLGTVVLEEVAFRGVLPALCRRRLGSDRTAIAVSSAVFGLWHVAPTLRALDANAVDSTRARAGAVACACVVTGIAGCYLCRLRRDGGLAAPAVAHAAVNGLGTIAAVIAHRVGEAPLWI